MQVSELITKSAREYLTDSSPKVTLNQQQLAALRYQILAYKLISKNMPLPPHLQQALFMSNEMQRADSSSSASDGVVPQQHDDTSRNGTGVSSTDSGPTTPASASSITAKALEQPNMSSSSPSQQPNAYASPYNLVKKPVSSTAHATRQHRLVIPSITSTGMDPHSMITERERRIKTHVQYRISELEKLPSNLIMSSPDIGSSSDDTTTQSNSKLKAVIELKALRLLNRQRKVTKGKGGT